MSDSYRSEAIELSESDLYLRLVDELKICRELMRGLAHKRKDQKWLQCANIMDQMGENVKTLYTRKSGVYIGRG